MASMQCHKPCDQTSYKLQKSHSADKCHDKHQTGGHNYGHMSSHTTHDKHQTGGHNGHMMSTHTTHHDKCHQTGGHGHGQMTLTNKVKEAVHSATKILHHDGSHKPIGPCPPGTPGHIGYVKPKMQLATTKSRQEGKNGHCMPKVRNMKKKKNHKGNKNSDCSDSGSGSSSSSSSDSESDCEKPKRKNC